MREVAVHAEPLRDLRVRVEQLIQKGFGRVEEKLFESGLLDSLRAIELGTMLEAEFGIPISDLTSNDLATITRIIEKLSPYVNTRRPR